MEPEAVAGEGAVDEQQCGAAVAKRAKPVQRQLHAVGRGEAARAHPYRPAARYEASSNSTGWRTRARILAAASPAPSCIRQPGLPVATTWGAASRSDSTLGARTARDIPGCTSVNNPALPQH